jgi:hypothetical protein
MCLVVTDEIIDDGKKNLPLFINASFLFLQLLATTEDIILLSQIVLPLAVDTDASTGLVAITARVDSMAF